MIGAMREAGSPIYYEPTTRSSWRNRVIEERVILTSTTPRIGVGISMNLYDPTLIGIASSRIINSHQLKSFNSISLAPLTFF